MRIISDLRVTDLQNCSNVASGADLNEGLAVIGKIEVSNGSLEF